MSSRTPDFANALAFARDLVRIPSPSGEEEAVARRVIEEMELLGFHDVRLDAYGNAIGCIPGIADGPSVMLSCHLDIVSAGDPEEWEHPPFAGVVADGFLHGRGAMDIKGPLALQTYAAAALAGRAPGDVIVAHTVFEERGGLGMKRLLAEGGVRPDAVIIGESTHGDVCLGHRGRAEVEIVLRGLAGHASAPERARNALDLLARALEASEDLAADQPHDPVLGAASVAVTSVEVAPESRNVIPDRVTVVLDWRILPSQTEEELLGRVRGALAEHLGEVPEGYAVEVRMATERQETWTGEAEEKGLFTPGFLMEADHPVVAAAASAVGRRDGTGPAEVRPWTFATDGGWTCGVEGIPTLGFAPGEERHAHTSTERLALDEAEWAFGRYPSLILAVMEALDASGG
jgi:putative selenium metabolism hydrolase